MHAETMPPASLYRPPTRLCPACNFREPPEDRSACTKCVPMTDTDVTMKSLLESEQSLISLAYDVKTSLQQLDELAELWGDEGKFRAARDRLRRALSNKVIARVMAADAGEQPHN